MNKWHNIERDGWPPKGMPVIIAGTFDNDDTIVYRVVSSWGDATTCYFFHNILYHGIAWAAFTTVSEEAML